MRGKIDRIVEDKGYGFIDDGSTDNVFFHINSFIDKVSIKDLNIGDIIEFEIGTGRDGRPAAINCKKIGSPNEYLKDYLIQNALIAPSRADGYDEFCDNVKEYALVLRDGKVTTSMIRKMYAQILASEDVMELKMLRPQFAYTAGRNEKNNILKEFMEMLDEIVKNMKPEGDLEEIKNFKQFMEAVVAYRKYVGEDE